MEEIKTDYEWRTWKYWPFFSRCATLSPGQVPATSPIMCKGLVPGTQSCYNSLQPVPSCEHSCRELVAGTTPVDKSPRVCWTLSPGQTPRRAIQSSNSRSRLAWNSYALSAILIRSSSNLNLLKFFLRVVHNSRSLWPEVMIVVNESLEKTLMRTNSQQRLCPDQTVRVESRCWGRLTPQHCWEESRHV